MPRISTPVKKTLLILFLAIIATFISLPNRIPLNIKLGKIYIKKDLIRPDINFKIGKFEVKKSFEELLNFTREYGVVSLEKSNGNLLFARLNNLSDSLTNTQLETISAKAELEAVQKLADEPIRIKQYALAQPKTGETILEVKE